MMAAGARLLYFLLVLALAALCNCSLFKAAEEVEKAAEKVTKPGDGKGEQKKPEPTGHEGPLLDNKVTALRVQEALKSAGPQFDDVKVEGTGDAVVMTGTVQSAAERARAEEIARGVRRSMKLRNELRVGK